MEAEDATDTAAAALDALRSATPEDERTPDTSAAALDALRAVAPHEDPLADLLADAAPLVDTDTGPEEALASVLSGSGAEFDPLADLLADELSPADEGEAGGDLPDPALPGEGAETAPDGLPDPAPAEDPLAALDAFLDPTPDAEIPAPATDDALAGPDDLLVGSAGGESVDPDAEDGADLDDLLATLGGEASAPDADAEEGAPEPDAEDGTDLDDLMAMLGGEASALGGEVAEIAPEPDAEDGTDLDDLLATLGGEASAPDADAEEGAPEPDAEDGTDLDDLLATLGGEASAPDADAEEGAPEPGAEDGTDLDDLLATFGGEASAPDAAAEEGAPAPVTEMEDSMALLDDLLAAPPQAAAARPAGPVIARITAPKPSAEALARPRFRMAVFGDFSGRAAAGKIETGDALARRRPIELDVDTVEEVIEGFATRLVLPVGPDGKGIEVPLGGLDDLHPDEIVGNCEIFEALKGLRQRLSVPSMAARAVAEMQGWAGEFTTQATATHRHSAASSVPTDRRLSDFQKLIGDVSGRLTQVSPVDDMIAQIIGPHVVPGPSPEAAVLKASVDAAMGSAMKLILHHPEFQAIEAQWRGLDLLARRIETDVKLQIILFDVSAEELAADLAASDDLAQTGLFRLLDAPLQEEGGIGFSALFGLYTFEETPPHAELLTRVAQVAAHVEAPFFAAITPGYLEVDLRDRHPLTARAWDGLRAHDAAGWLGLVTPRFLLRRPYGRKSDPIDAFEFEEFSEQEGLKGMLWANPVLLTALLMAAEWKAGGPKMTLGGQMSMGDMPYHFARDRHGDQVALPCTERNMTEALVRHTMTRGYMPVVSIRGRDVVRLASFQSLAGSEIAGPWSGAPPVRDKGPVASGLDLEMEMPAPDDGVETGETGDTAAAAEDDLDALLASFGDVDTPSDPNAIDAELAALLEGL
ncbi:type VI secretion system contractile sheath domain-containing protein [Szabonella alba]